MKRPRRPIMSMMRIRRSECRETTSATLNGVVILDEKTWRRSSFEKPATNLSSAVFTPYQMKPQMT